MKTLTYGSIIVTLVATPWVSSDALIIPKMIMLACLGSFFLPQLISNSKVFFLDVKLKLLLILSTLFLIQMIIAVLISKAPFEQELFGRTGRGLGFITYFSLVVLLLFTAIKIDFSDISKISQGLLISCLFSSIYSIFQFFGLDFFDWNTRTNGVIGTIGNPNFQSSFVSIAFIPSLVYLWERKQRWILIVLVTFVLIFTLYICESTQGYIALLASIITYILIYIWYHKSRLIFSFISLSTVAIGISTIAGMLNHGPFSYYLYKVSVRSRGEMWQTAAAVIKDNPWFGIGLDSLGDYSLMYRSKKTAAGINEYMDNSHNFFLQFASTGGVLLAVYYLGIIVLSLYCFFSIQKHEAKYNKKTTALFAAWVSFQLQSFISPAAIPTLLWNFIFCGALIGLSVSLKLNRNSLKDVKASGPKINNKPSINLLSLTSIALALALTYPLFNADKLARRANVNRDALLAVKAAQMYPESVVRYNLLGSDLYLAGLNDFALEIAKSAVKFNPNSYQTWILILVNPNATDAERLKARDELVKIDPLNEAIKTYIQYN